MLTTFVQIDEQIYLDFWLSIPYNNNQGRGDTMNQKERLMKVLDISEQEALEILATDKEIDKGADPFPLTAEQKKVEKKARQADRKPTAYKFTKRERKPNETKGHLIAEIANFLTNSVDNLEITNKERVIAFEVDGKKFELTLTQKRK